MTIVGMADHLCKDAEFRLQNTFQIKTNLQEADEKTKAQIIGEQISIFYRKFADSKYTAVLC